MKKMVVSIVAIALCACGGGVDHDQQTQALVTQLQKKCAERGQKFVVDDVPQGNMVVSGKCVGP